MKTSLHFFKNSIGSVAPLRSVYMAATRTPEEAMKEAADSTAVSKPSPTKTKVSKVDQAMLNIEKKKANIFSRGLWGTVHAAKGVKAFVTGDVNDDNHSALVGVIKSNVEKATKERLSANKNPLDAIEDKAMKKLLAADKNGNRKLALARVRASVITDAIRQIDAALTALETRKASYGDAIEKLKAGKQLDSKVEDLQLRKSILESLENDNTEYISKLNDDEKLDDVKKYDAIIRGVIDASRDDKARALAENALYENSLGNGKKVMSLLQDLFKGKKISEQDYKTASEAAKLLRRSFFGLGKKARLHYAETIRTRSFLTFDQWDVAADIPLAPPAIAKSFTDKVKAGPDDTLKGQLITIHDTTNGKKIDAVVLKRDDSSESLLLADRSNKHQFYSINLDPTAFTLGSYNALNKVTDTNALSAPCMVQKDAANRLVRRNEYKDPSRVYLTI